MLPRYHRQLLHTPPTLGRLPPCGTSPQMKWDHHRRVERGIVPAEIEVKAAAAAADRRAAFDDGVLGTAVGRAAIVGPRIAL